MSLNKVRYYPFFSLVLWQFNKGHNESVTKLANAHEDTMMINVPIDVLL